MRFTLDKYETKDVIKIIREWTNLTQKEFAKSIGKSERTIQDYESGRRRYYANTLKHICKIHNIEVIIQKKR